MRSSAAKTECEDRIFCETHKCEISVSGCLARQKRANRGVADGKWGAYGRRGSQVPYDPACVDCEQGKMVSGVSVQVSGRKAKVSVVGADSSAQHTTPEKQNTPEKPKPPAETKNQKPWKPDELVKYNPGKGWEPTSMEQIKQEQKDGTASVYSPSMIVKTMEDKQESTSQKPGEIPYGYCHCGCGEKTTISHCTDAAHGYVKGEPRMYVKNHHLRVKGKTKNKKVDTIKKAENSKPGPVEPPKHWLDFLRQLKNGKELENELIRRAVYNLREVEAQAVWELAEALRKNNNNEK